MKKILTFLLVMVSSFFLVSATTTVMMAKTVVAQTDNSEVESELVPDAEALPESAPELELESKTEPEVEPVASGSVFALVEYEGRDQLDELFESADVNIEYFEGKGIDKSAFLGIFSSDSFYNLVQKGYIAHIYSNNIEAEMSGFRMVTHQQPIYEEDLESLGKAYKITDYFYVLKIAENPPENLNEALSEFIIVPFPKESLPTPLYRTTTITMPPSPTNDPLEDEYAGIRKPDEPRKSYMLYIGLSFFAVLAVATIGVLYIKKRRQGEKN